MAAMAKREAVMVAKDDVSAEVCGSVAGGAINSRFQHAARRSRLSLQSTESGTEENTLAPGSSSEVVTRSQMGVLCRHVLGRLRSCASQC